MLVALLLAKNLFLQFLALFGCWVGAAAALSYLSRAMNRAFQDCAYPRLGLYLFGWIGIPVHEFSHAFFAKLFAHDINDVKWFDPEAKDGAHGAVTHSFSRWNLYHRVGHFFIGLAPAILGPAFIGALLYWLVPPSRVLFHTSLEWPNAARLAELARALLNRTTLRSPKFYAFLYLAVCIASQIELSKEDLKQAVRGLLPLSLVLLLVNFVWATAVSGWHWPSLSGFRYVEEVFTLRTEGWRNFLFASLVFAIAISTLTWLMSAIFSGVIRMVVPGGTDS